MPDSECLLRRFFFWAKGRPLLKNSVLQKCTTFAMELQSQTAPIRLPCTSRISFFSTVQKVLFVKIVTQWLAGWEKTIFKTSILNDILLCVRSCFHDFYCLVPFSHCLLPFCLFLPPVPFPLLRSSPARSQPPPISTCAPRPLACLRGLGLRG